MQPFFIYEQSLTMGFEFDFDLSFSSDWLMK